MILAACDLWLCLVACVVVQVFRLALSTSQLLYCKVVAWSNTCIAVMINTVVLDIAVCLIL